MSADADEGRPGAAPPAGDERAERLARLRDASAAGAGAGAEAGADDPAALAAFLRVLRGAIADDPPDAPQPAAGPQSFAPAAAVLPFQRPPERPPERAPERGPERAPGRPSRPGDLDRLPGAGPGLVWALERAGVARLADLAACAPAPLADRLGPVGALLDLPAWIAFARAETAAETATETSAAIGPETGSHDGTWIN